MDYAFQGQPFVDVPAKSDIDLKTMDYAYQAQPFVRNPAAAPPPVVGRSYGYIFSAICSLFSSQFVHFFLRS
jgi:hypothetical protein